MGDLVEETAGRAICPGCGYDLRGHPDDARCPECGQTVSVSDTFRTINQWADRKLLDLWSVFVLQAIGSVAAAFSLLAVARGQYVALVLALAAGLYIGAGLLWYLFLLASLVRRARSHTFALLKKPRRRQLRRWTLLNAAITAIAVAIILILRRM